MFDKLATVEVQYDELMARLGTTEVQSDVAEYRKSAKALSDLEPLVQKYREYMVVQRGIEGAEELVKGADPDMREMAHAELKETVFLFIARPRGGAGVVAREEGVIVAGGTLDDAGDVGGVDLPVPV